MAVTLPQIQRRVCRPLPGFFAALRMTHSDPSVILRSEATKNLVGAVGADFAECSGSGHPKQSYAPAFRLGSGEF